MPIPHQTYIVELASGAVDGVNETFETSRDYQPGTLQSHLRGMARHTDTEPKGVIELGGRVFKFNEAPEEDDMPFVGYAPTS